MFYLISSLYHSLIFCRSLLQWMLSCVMGPLYQMAMELATILIQITFLSAFHPSSHVKEQFLAILLQYLNPVFTKWRSFVCQQITLQWISLPAILQMVLVVRPVEFPLWKLNFNMSDVLEPSTDASYQHSFWIVVYSV